MAIYFGSDKIKEIYVGSDKIKEVYHGSELVWSGETNDSYAVLSDDTIVEFSEKNTPVENFATDGNSTTDIVVNGNSFQKYRFRQLVFGESYNGITELLGFPFVNFSGITLIDMRSLVSLTKISHRFCWRARDLIELYIGATTPPSAGAMYFLGDTDSLENIYVPAASVAAYKAATRWGEHADKISGF